GAAGAEGGRVIVIRAAPGGPREVSAKDVVKDFVNSVMKGKSMAEARLRNEKQPAATSRGAKSAPAPATIIPGTTAPAEKAVDDASTPIEVGDTVNIETSLVSIPVIVTDQTGKYIPDLAKGNFRVLEDGVEQQVEEFSTTEEPFNIVLMIDSSGSTRFK